MADDQLGGLESLGALTGLVNDNSLEAAKKRALISSTGSTLLDQILGRNSEGVLGQSLLDALSPGSNPNGAQAGPGPGGALAMPPGQPSQPSPPPINIPPGANQFANNFTLTNMPGAGGMPAPTGASGGGMPSPGMGGGGMPQPSAAGPTAAPGGLSWPAIAAAIKARSGGNSQLAGLALQKLLPFFQQQSQEKTANATEAYRNALLLNATGGGANAISPEAEAYWTDYFQKTGTLPPGLARTAQGSRLVQKIMNDVGNGTTKPGDMIANKAELAGTMAGERTLAQRATSLGIATNEVKRFLPIALQLSNKIDRTQFPSLNAVLLAAQKGSGGTVVAQFAAANNAVINAYSQIITRGGVPTDASRKAAEEVLSTAYSNGQYAAVASQIMQEANAALKAPGDVKAELRQGMTGEAPPADNAASAPAAAPQTATGPNGEKVQWDGQAWVPVQ